MMKVDIGKCIGCQACMAVCPFDAIIMVNDKAQIENIQCRECGQCKGICRVGAIIEEQQDKGKVIPTPINKVSPLLSLKKSIPKGLRDRDW